MRSDITGKFEINVSTESSPTELADAGHFTARNRCPALVVPPMLVAPALVERSKLRALYRIVAAVDFGISTLYALDKFKSLSRDVFAADDYDVVLSAGRTEVETINEIRVINEFLRDRINPTAEIRYVLNFSSREEKDVLRLLEAAKRQPPAYLRTDSSLLLPKERCSLELHRKRLLFLKQHCATRVKLSGNVDLATCQALRMEVARFDVGVAQGMRILHEAEEDDRRAAQTQIQEAKAKEEVLHELGADVQAFMRLGYTEQEAVKRAKEGASAES